MEQIKISAISYLNTAPFVYGLKQCDLQAIDITFDTPAVCAKRLQEKQVDLGIVPVAAIPQIPDARIISDYCIGADGAVRTVVILSTSPVAEIKKLYIDTDSRTSAMLAQLLLKHHWSVSPSIYPLDNMDKIDSRQANTGYVLIGDKVFNFEDQFPFNYDLAAEWKAFCGKPFVFASWTAIRPLPTNFIESFNAALSFGIQHIDEAVRAHSSFVVNEQTAIDYLTKNISYNFDKPKHEALTAFWNLIAKDVGWS